MNGFDGARVTASTGDMDESYRIVGCWLQQEDEVSRFVGVAAGDRAGQMEDALDRMTQGYRRLTDERILAIEPARLTVITTRASGTLRDAVGQRVPPRGLKLDDLAILNGVAVDDVIPAGTRLKLPR